MRNEDKADIINEIKALKSVVSEMQADLEKVKAEVTAKQPSKKFKVATTATDKDNNLITRYANDTAREVGLAVKNRGSVSTAEMEQLLADNGVDVSRPTVINIMRRYASEFEQFKALEPKKQVRRSVHLRYTA